MVVNTDPTIHDPRYHKIINRITQLRQRAGVSQMQLAKEMGIEQPDVSKIENCERRLDSLELIRYLETVAPSISKQIEQLLNIDCDESQ